MLTVKHTPRLEFLDIRGLRYAIRHWGAPDAPRLFLLHGWMDSSATFQFVVDALQHDWHIIAPDWRGYGASQYLNHPYWFPDYYADLDALLAHYSPDEPARVIAHSMGASIASAYGAARPNRLAKLVMVDFLGLHTTHSDSAPQYIADWLDAQGATPRLGSYADHAALAHRLRASNPRLSLERATYLAHHVGRMRLDGRVEMACDPWHRVASPVRYQVDDVLANWQAIACPVLLLIADRGYVLERFPFDSPEFSRRRNAFRQAQVETVEDSGHNMQHDQPEALARASEHFLTANQ